MRLVVGILLIALGIWSLTTGVMSLVDRERLIRHSRQAQSEDVQPTTYYVVPTGWLAYLSSIGIPLVVLFGGGLLIRDHQLLITET